VHAVERVDWVGLAAITVMMIFLISGLAVIVFVLEPRAEASHERQRIYQECLHQAETLEAERACAP
jgi:F0F1-type ATP synthase membrane subunit b/b'